MVGGERVENAVGIKFIANRGEGGREDLFGVAQTGPSECIWRLPAKPRASFLAS